MTLFEGHESQVQPRSLSKIEREDKVDAALDGRYDSGPVIARQQMTFSGLPIHEGGIMKQGTSHLNQNKLQHGGLNRGYSPDVHSS
jgi:hypothetical protein